MKMLRKRFINVHKDCGLEAMGRRGSDRGGSSLKMKNK